MAINNDSFPQNLRSKLMIKKLKYYVLSYSIIFLIGAIIGEVILRYKNIKPLGSDKPEIEVSPGNRYFKTDSILGYHHLAGKFEVTLKKTYQFTTTHNKTGLRITDQTSVAPRCFADNFAITSKYMR